MRFAICLSCVLLVLVGMASGVSIRQKPIYDLDDAPELFEEFINDYNRNYKDAEDKQIHYEAFLKTLKSINRLNANPDQSATFDINKFADYTEQEWKQMHGISGL